VAGSKFLPVYSFFTMLLQTFVISGKSVRVLIYRKGPKLTPEKHLKKWGGTPWRICGYGASHGCIIQYSIQLLVITGATDGIGREFALQLAKAGFGVVLVSRNPEKLQRLANSVSETQSPDATLLTLPSSRGAQCRCKGPSTRLLSS